MPLRSFSSNRDRISATRERSVPRNLKEGENGWFPFLDAAVAAGFGHDKLSLSDIEPVASCSDTIDDLKTEVSRSIRAAQRQAVRNKGRIVEHTSEDIELGENYVASVNGVTVSCFVTGPTDVTTTNGQKTEVGPAAYASHLLVSNDMTSMIPTNIDPYAYNVTVFLEADVLELGANGALFIPQKHCFDFEDFYDRGLTVTGSHASNVATSKRTHSVSFGGKQVFLTSYVNRASLMDVSIQQNTSANFIRQAYQSTKLELSAILDVADEIEQGKLLFGVECAFTTENENSTASCVEEKIMERAKEYSRLASVPFDEESLTTALNQYTYMQTLLDEWIDYHNRFGSSGAPSITEFFQTPPLFDETLASRYKNCDYPPVEANPFFAPDVLSQKMTFDPQETANLNSCVDSEAQSTTASLASHFSMAYQRRLHQYDGGVPQNHLSTWTLYGNQEETYDAVLGPNAYYFAQNVSFSLGRVRDGHLTSKTMGKNANFLAATAYMNVSDTQDMLAAQRQTPTYTRTANHINSENPCENAATDADIYLLVFGMAAAACGGVNAILASVHHALRWTSLFVCGCCAGHNSNDGVTETQWKRFLPTYELFLVTLGCLVFFSLYLPVFLQVVKEHEIANFEFTSVDLDVVYGSYRVDEEILGGGRPALVTMVETAVKCTEARPELLRNVLIVGLVLGIAINIPFAHRAAFALFRCCKGMRVSNPDSSVERRTNCSIRDRELDILIPPEPTANNENVNHNGTEVVLVDNGQTGIAIVDNDVVESPRQFFETKKIEKQVNESQNESEDKTTKRPYHEGTARKKEGSEPQEGSDDNTCTMGDESS